MKDYKITAVSYLNTKPFLNGILNHPIQNQLDISLDIPSICAEKLVHEQVDIGLVPVAVIPKLSNPHIISDFCIGAIGKVRTVAIFSEVPIEKITHLYLDHHSNTSVALAQILLKEYWNVSPILLPASDGYIQNLKGTTAGVVIGDRTINIEEQFEYVYDLSTAWEAHTGLPFVFAAWVSNRPLPSSFIADFNAALAKGLELIPQLMLLLPKPHPNFDLDDYFRKYISYELDAAKRKALALFLSKLSSLHQIPERSLQFC